MQLFFIVINDSIPFSFYIFCGLSVLGYSKGLGPATMRTCMCVAPECIQQHQRPHTCPSYLNKDSAFVLASSYQKNKKKKNNIFCFFFLSLSVFYIKHLFTEDTSVLVYTYRSIPCMIAILIDCTPLHFSLFSSRLWSSKHLKKKNKS
jgi:hypothetical protein